MSFDYIANTYGLKLKKGQVVTALGKLGVVTKATHHVWVRLSEEKVANPYHPSDVKVLNEESTR